MDKKRCEWFEKYLKLKLKEKELKDYNRAKTLVYYFPTLVFTVNQGDFELAMMHPYETFICLGKNDARYPFFDEVYKKNYGKEFEPLEWGETRYLTIGDVFNYFKL